MYRQRIINNIGYRCLNCSGNLAKVENAYVCRKCGESYSSYVVEGIEIIDFRKLSSSPCQCNRDGETRHTIDLATQFIEIRVKQLQKQSDVPLPLKAKTILRTCGTDNLILDIGCADAPYGQMLSTDNYLYGMDQCPQRLFDSAENALCKGYKAILIGDCTSIPFQNANIDVIIATEVIEHITETRKCLREMKRVLKRGGKAIISVPNLVSIYNRISILFGSGLGLAPWKLISEKTIYDKWTSIRYPEQSLHVRFFTFDSLQKLLCEEGFNIVEMTGIDHIFEKIHLNNIFIKFCEDILVVAESV
ncbi:MAG: class I SAM-dependent methyltransferase [Planctomycetota bacterium]|nr:class I SAM-dependent methyltransferase [Planctomycetota bacterium]MDE2216261.1 class I SAM-dependent methyltransferase [Planctomycetota bacterium]